MDNQKTLLLGTTDLKYGDYETERSKRRKKKIGCSILSIAIIIILIVVLSVTLTSILFFIFFFLIKYFNSH